MQLDRGAVFPRLRAQLLARPDTVLMTAGIADPDRQRRSPVTVPPQRPINIIFEPVAETTVLNMTGVPVDPLVQLDQPVLEFARPDIPDRPRVVQERRVAAPAERIRMADFTLTEENPARFEIPEDQRIGLFNENYSDRKSVV